jgi:SynChlorMet cassette radical SAM/SPASM protein ScmF
MVEYKVDLPEGIPALNTYYVYLTGGCNLACQHCWISPTYQAHGGTGGHLDYDLFALAVSEGLTLGLNSVKLTGGEPLLHPDFKRIVNLIRAQELSLTIETNGTLLTAELAKYLKEHSTLSHISVSLDGGTAETHDPFRGVKGSYEKAVQGIRNLVDVGIHPQVIMSLHARNVGDVESLVRLAEKLGCDSVKFNLIQPSGRGELMTQRGQVLDFQSLIKLGKWVERELQQNTRIPLFYSWPMAFYGLKRLQGFNAYSCSLTNILGILSTGHLAMCGIGAQIPDLCYGKIGLNQIRDLWISHPNLVAIRDNLSSKLEGICRSCIFQNQCKGVCVAENYNASGKLTSSYWFCEMADSTGFFPETRLKPIHREM